MTFALATLSMAMQHATLATWGTVCLGYSKGFPFAFSKKIKLSRVATPPKPLLTYPSVATVRC